MFKTIQILISNDSLLKTQIFRKNVQLSFSETVRISTFLTDQKGDPVKIKHLRYRFKIGHRVRLTHLRNIFTRQYEEKWTGEKYLYIFVLIVLIALSETDALTSL
jgi:hypothetical protein